MDYNYCGIHRDQALKDYDLDAYTYIDTIDNIDDYVDTELKSAISSLIQKQDYKKIVCILKKKKDKFQKILDNPKSLSFENKRDLFAIRTYFNRNTGRLNGYYSFRKEKTDQVIQTYKQQETTNRKFLIANQEQIHKTIDDLISSYQDKYQQKLQETTEIRQQNKQDWHSTYITCVCGVIIQQGCKARHEKTLSHQLKLNSVPLPDTRNKWHLIKFKCSCGKMVTNGNRSAHEKTQYHLTHRENN